MRISAAVRVVHSLSVRVCLCVCVCVHSTADAAHAHQRCRSCCTFVVCLCVCVCIARRMLQTSADHVDQGKCPARFDVASARRQCFTC